MTNPVNMQFNAIPRTFKGCVYVAEMKNGLVKVGFSRNPRTRLRSLSSQAKRKFGTEICRFHIGSDIHARDAMTAEASALHRLRQIGEQFPETLEFFSNVKFGIAVNMVNQMTRCIQERRGKQPQATTTSAPATETVRQFYHLIDSARIEPAKQETASTGA